jgi:hypothetical protein
MSKNTSCVTQSYSIAHALCGEYCPYCGKRPAKILEHIKQCENVEINVEVGELFDKQGYVYAFHEECGDAMILKIDKGLALIENKYARYVVPASTLRCGGIADVVEAIRRAKLSVDQTKGLISYLIQLNHITDFESSHSTTIGKLQLAEGSKVEVCLNGDIKTGTVRKKYSEQQYLIAIDGGPTVNMYKRDIRNL